jgi:nucleoside-diphosphate-sugar epimerase
VFGPDPSVPLPPLVGDDTLATPKTSYGTHKLICEQLVADYSRKGYIDGRSARLMTVTVRPGRPNGAASSFFSGIVREPLAGVESICPVSPDVSHAVTSVARTVEGLIAVYEASVEQLGGRLGLNLPAVNVTVAEMLAALEEVAGPEVRERVRFVRDETIANIVANWPKGATAARAAPPGPAPRQELRRHHPPVHRRLPRRPGRSAIAQGPRQGTFMNKIDLEGRVAVVTGGAQGIGYAIAERMLASGASVSLWDADAAKLAEAKGTLGNAGRVFAEELDLTERERRRGGRGAHDRRGRQDRHRRQQRRHHRRQRHDLGAHARRLAPRHRGEPGRALPRLPRDRAAPDREEVRADRQHRVGRRQGRQPERVALQRVQGGRDRAHQVARQGARRQGHPRQRGRAGGGEDGDVRDHDAAAHRLHALEDPDGALPRGERSGGDGRLARVGRLLVQHRVGVRPLGRPRHLLIASAVSDARAGSVDMIDRPPRPETAHETSPRRPAASRVAARPRLRHVAAPPSYVATTLQPTTGNTAAGTVWFIADGGDVRIRGRITGLKANQEHGFHVHEKGDCSSGDAMSAGGHLNPSGKPHGPPSGEHHAGDLPALKPTAPAARRSTAGCAASPAARPSSPARRSSCTSARTTTRRSRPATRARGSPAA